MVCQLHSSLVLASLWWAGDLQSVYLIYTLSYLVILDYNSVSKTQGCYNGHPWKPLPPGQRMLRAQCCVPLSPGHSGIPPSPSASLCEILYFTFSWQTPWCPWRSSPASPWQLSRLCCTLRITNMCFRYPGHVGGWLGTQEIPSPRKALPTQSAPSSSQSRH